MGGFLGDRKWSMIIMSYKLSRAEKRQARREGLSRADIAEYEDEQRIFQRYENEPDYKERVDSLFEERHGHRPYGRFTP